MLGMLPVFSPEHLSEADSGGSSGPSTTRVSNEEEAREDAVRRQPRKRRVLTAARKEQNRVAQRAFRMFYTPCCVEDCVLNPSDS